MFKRCGDGSLVVGGVVISTWGGGGICLHVSWTNNNHPPRIGCLLARKQVVVLACQLAEVGEQDYAKNTKSNPESTSEYSLRQWKLADGVAGLSHILRRVRNNNTAIGGIIRVWHHATIDREQSGVCLWEILWLFFLWREARFYVEMYKWIRTHKMWDDVSCCNNTKER